MIYRSKKKGGFDAMIRKARTAYKYCIGIDTGTHTGVAVWNREERRFEILAEMKIHKAMFIVSEYAKVAGDKVLVRVEDARKRNKYGDRSEFKLQGAGSVKRDSTIWEDYLKDLKIDYDMVAPQNNHTKLDSETFAKLTGYSGRTNEHNRDAGMLVFGL